MKKTFPEDRVNLGVNKITPYQPGKSSDSLNISKEKLIKLCLLYTSPSPRDRQKSRMPSSA